MLILHKKDASYGIVHNIYQVLQSTKALDIPKSSDVSVVIMTG